MTVKGSLEYQGLEQLLRADLAAQGGGRLVLRHGAHYAALYLDEAGLYVLHPVLLDAEMILEGFVTRDLLDADLLARMRRQHGAGVGLLDTLVRDGLVPEGEFMEVLAREIEDSILDMMLWSEGSYVFEKEPANASELGLLTRICVDPVGVAERALVRLDRRRSIGDLLGDHAILFFPEAGDLPTPRDEADRIHEIYAMLDGARSAPEIALRLGLSRYQVLDMIARLVDAGAARTAQCDELARAAGERSRAGQHAIARALALQWAEMEPGEPAPLRKLASLGAEAGDIPAQIEALCALGDLHLKAGQHAEALEVFTQAMRHAPADEVVLTGLRLAAEQAGDGDAFVDGTLLTAQTKLDEGQPDAALELLEPLARSYPTNMAVHLLRARALILGEKRSEFFEEAALVGQVLSKEGCRSKADRDVVEYFRQTIVTLAPDRGDLLERFRAIYDPRRRRRRRFAMVVAFLLLLAAGGVYFWPASASALLDRARHAADAGDKGQAIRLIGELIENYPDAPETEEAYLLQARLVPPPPPSKRKVEALAVLKSDVESLLPAFAAALPSLPDPEAQAAVRAVFDPLDSNKGKPFREDVLASQDEAVLSSLNRLREECLRRVKILSETAGLADRHAHDLAGLRDALDQTDTVSDPVWLANLRASSELLTGLTRLRRDATMQRASSELSRAAKSLKGALAFHAEHAPKARYALASMELQEAERRCREEAPKLMVAGQLDQADALYAQFESVLALYEDKEPLEKILAGVRRRHVPELIKDRRAQVADIRHRLADAQQAEDAGDLERAVGIYAALVKEHWLIRFENICTLPLEIATVPTGAAVLMDGREIGRGPVVVRYAWGSEASVEVRAPGYEAQTVVLRTAEEKPPARETIHLVPTARWTAAVSRHVRTQPLAEGEDLVLVDRRGLVTVLSRKDGTVRWSRDLSSLEGIRARPARARSTLYVARVDGRVFRLDAADGTVRGTLQLSRAFGDLAALGSDVALATTTGSLVVLRDGAVAHRTPLDGVPSAGVVSAHGAFWVGTAKGSVVRLDPITHQRRVVPVTRGTAPVDRVVPCERGVLVTTSDGVLLFLEPEGRIRWKQTGFGDLVGAPVCCGEHVLAANRKGIVHVREVTHGEPVRTVALESAPLHGLVADGTSVVAVCQNGLLWAYDPAANVVLVELAQTGAPDVPAAALDGAVLVPCKDGGLALLPTPRKP